MASEQQINVYIVEERENPSTDFFILPCFPACDYDVKRCRFHELVEEFGGRVKISRLHLLFYTQTDIGG